MARTRVTARRTTGSKPPRPRPFQEQWPSDSDDEAASANPYAWLLDDHPDQRSLSDVTVILSDGQGVTIMPDSSVATSSLGSSTAAAPEGPQQSLKRVKRCLCRCAQDTQQTDSIPPAQRSQIVPSSGSAREQHIKFEHGSVQEQHIKVEPEAAQAQGPACKPVSLSRNASLDLQGAFPASFKLHTVVLSSASRYFRKNLTLSTGGGWCPECKVSTHVLEGRQLEAAVHVLRFMYTHKLPCCDGLVLDGALWLWMIKVRRNSMTLIK